MWEILAFGVSVLALVVSGASYWHARSVKKLDLRIEARKARTRLLEDIKRASNLVHDANQSRIAVASATGRLQSGSMEIWHAHTEEGFETIKEIRADIKGDGRDYGDMSEKEIEAEIARLTGYQSRIETILNKYREEINQDDRMRERIYQEAQNRRR